MEPHWLKLRWPITVLALGAMVIGLVVRTIQWGSMGTAYRCPIQASAGRR